jgi:hypothetical protein
MNKKFDRWQKLQNVAHRLNWEAYKQTNNGRTYYPCDKARVFIDACNNDQVILQITMEAALTPCYCHMSNVTENDLFEMLYDDRWRMAHYGEGKYP